MKAKSSLGKLTGTATVTRKNGQKEEVQLTAKATPEQLQKLVNSGKFKTSEEK
jgi:hypothetical protein